MILPSPRLLVAAANAFIGVHAEADARRTAFLELMMADMSSTNRTWDAVFVHHVGFWSHYDHYGRTSTWPLPALSSCDDLAAYAKDRGVLLGDPHPAHGDVFLQWSATLKRYARAGIVIAPLSSHRRFHGDAPFVECCVIEGNSDAAGRLGGDAIVRITRKLFLAQHDRVIRWTALALSVRTADPMRLAPAGARIDAAPIVDLSEEWAEPGQPGRRAA